MHPRPEPGPLGLRRGPPAGAALAALVRLERLARPRARDLSKNPSPPSQQLRVPRSCIPTGGDFSTALQSGLRRRTAPPPGRPPAQACSSREMRSSGCGSLCDGSPPPVAVARPAAAAVRADPQNSCLVRSPAPEPQLHHLQAGPLFLRCVPTVRRRGRAPSRWSLRRQRLEALARAGSPAPDRWSRVASPHAPPERVPALHRHHRFSRCAPGAPGS